MSGLRISEREWIAVDDVRFKTKDVAVFRNGTIVIMSAAGRTVSSIARELGCSTGTVDNVRSAYRKRGIEGLFPSKSSGRPPRADARYRKVLRETIVTPPGALGYAFSVWSIGRLNAHLAKVTGKRFAEEHLRRMLHQEGFSFQRPKHTMKGKRDEAAYLRAAAQLKTLKKRQWPRTLRKN
jgi:transposase